MKDIILTLQRLSNLHNLVRGFSYGSLADLNDDWAEYPIVFVEVDETLTTSGDSIATSQDVFEVDVYFYAKNVSNTLNEPTNKINASINSQMNNLDSMERIAREFLYKWVDDFENDEVNTEPFEYTIAPLLNDYNSNLDGVRLSVTVRVYRAFCDYANSFGAIQTNDEEYKDSNY